MPERGQREFGHGETGGPASFASGECAQRQWLAQRQVLGRRPQSWLTHSHRFACTVAAPYSCCMYGYFQLTSLNHSFRAWTSAASSGTRWDGTRRAVAAMARDGHAPTRSMTRSFVDFVLVPSIVCNMVRVADEGFETGRGASGLPGVHRQPPEPCWHDTSGVKEVSRPGMEMAWTFSACVSSVLGICMDVRRCGEAGRHRPAGPAGQAAVRDEEGGSKVARMNAKFHLAVGQLLTRRPGTFCSPCPNGDDLGDRGPSPTSRCWT